MHEQERVTESDPKGILCPPVAPRRSSGVDCNRRDVCGPGQLPAMVEPDGEGGEGQAHVIVSSALFFPSRLSRRAKHVKGK